MDAMLNSMLKYKNGKQIPIFGFEKIQSTCCKDININRQLKSKTNSDFISLLEEHTNAWVDLVNRRGFIMSVTNFIYLLKHSKWKPEPF